MAGGAGANYQHWGNGANEDCGGSACANTAQNGSATAAGGSSAAYCNTWWSGSGGGAGGTGPGAFAYAVERLGLVDEDGGPRSGLETLQLPSPFDYARQSILYVPTHLPEASSPEFAAQASNMGSVTSRPGASARISGAR